MLPNRATHHILHLILSEKRCQDIGLKYTSCVISNFSNASVVYDDYPETLTTTDNTSKCFLGNRISPRIVFEPDVLFKEKRMCF